MKPKVKRRQSAMPMPARIRDLAGKVRDMGMYGTITNAVAVALEREYQRLMETTTFLPVRPDGKPHK